MRQRAARRRLGDASGNQAGEFFFILAGFGILVAFGLGNCEKFRTRKEVRSSQCLENLLRIERGTEVHELSCPVVNLPYREEERTSGTVIVCPDPEKHLRLDSYLARRGEGWDFQTTLASASGNSPDSSDPIELDYIPAPLKVDSSGVILELGPGFLFRYVALPFGLLFSILCLVVGLSLMVDALRDPDHSIKEALIECAVIFVFVVGLMSTVTAAIAIDLGGWDERVELNQAERSITIRECLLSRWHCTEERLDSVRAVLPAFAGERFSAVAFYEEDGELRRRTLFRSSGKDWERVALMNGVFAPARYTEAR
ncbi:MAG: hypothetical protein E2P02_03540 [Acidobacteria bacterium]|nr:MAG: hypothetical protein E2P02_03540 [Acidobacteriota bacterium]